MLLGDWTHRALQATKHHDLVHVIFPILQSRPLKTRICVCSASPNPGLHLSPIHGGSANHYYIGAVRAPINSRSLPHISLSPLVFYCRGRESCPPWKIPMSSQWPPLFMFLILGLVWPSTRLFRSKVSPLRFSRSPLVRWGLVDLLRVSSHPHDLFYLAFSFFYLN